MAKLGDICTVVSGSTPKTGVAEYWDGTVKWITPAELNEDSFYITDSVRHITEDGKEKTGLSYLPKGTVILSSRAPIGKTAIAGCEMCCNQGFKNLICSDAVYNEYLYFFLKSKTDYLNSLGRGATFKEISKSIVEKVEIPLPNIEKQHQIVKELKATRNLITHRKQQLTKLDELIKARFVEMFENNTYPKVKVSTVCDFITKGTTPPNDLISEEYSSDKVPYLKVYNLSFNGELLFDTAPQYISENIHNGMLARSKVYPNDVLMNIVGPPLGKFSLVTDEFPEWNINQAIAIFRAKEKINPKYLLSALMQPEVLNPFLRQAVGIRQLNLSLSQCRDLEIFLPPLSLQNQFADFVAEVDKSKVEVQKALDQTQLLFDSLMQQYFG